MFKYTPLLISRWIGLGPRLWLILALVMAVSLLTVAEPPTVWVWSDEVGCFWPRSSRVGRWVWRLGRVLWASRWSLIGRVGLCGARDWWRRAGGWPTVRGWGRWSGYRWWSGS